MLLYLGQTTLTGGYSKSKPSHSNMLKQTIVCLGAGNVATHLVLSLKASGHRILGILSRTRASAETLVERVGEKCSVWTELNQIPPADFYLCCLSDNALLGIAAQWPKHLKGIVLHTSGSIPLSVLSPIGSNVGVLYPLQTFSKDRALPFSEIPCFIEAATPEVEQKIADLARTVSQRVTPLASSARLHLHLSAVFACNFVNHLYGIAMELLQKQGIDPRWLQPLVRETAQKIADLTPTDAQTGPARRGDWQVMSTHLALLSEQPKLHALYQLMSELIAEQTHPHASPPSIPSLP